MKHSKPNYKNHMMKVQNEARKELMSKFENMQKLHPQPQEYITTSSNEDELTIQDVEMAPLTKQEDKKVH